MSLTAGILNLILGAVYTSYGVMTIMDLRGGWRTRGFSHFGMAWILMAFTCGPHHLHHGAHILFQGRDGGALDVLVVAVGFPAGVIWFLLRVEAMMGGAGDRIIRGTPAFVEALPTLLGVYLAALVTLVAAAGTGIVEYDAIVTPNLALIVLYTAIGLVLLRTQIANHATSGTWSTSGISLAIVFPTCGLMHGVYALYASTARYEADIHGFAIDILAVPAAMYFLWVVWSLSRGVIVDWNRAAADSTPTPRDDADEPLRVTMP